MSRDKDIEEAIVALDPDTLVDSTERQDKGKVRLDVSEIDAVRSVSGRPARRTALLTASIQANRSKAKDLIEAARSMLENKRLALVLILDPGPPQETKQVGVIVGEWSQSYSQIDNSRKIVASATATLRYR